MNIPKCPQSNGKTKLNRLSKSLAKQGSIEHLLYAWLEQMLQPTHSFQTGSKQYLNFTGGIEMAIDPICKMEIEEGKAASTSEYKGKKYYFCAVGCKKAFDQDPEKYLTDENK